jgi:hypothetical protein
LSTSDSERRKRRAFEELERKLISLRDDVDLEKICLPKAVVVLQQKMFA